MGPKALVSGPQVALLLWKVLWTEPTCGPGSPLPDSLSSNSTQQTPLLLMPLFRPLGISFHSLYTNVNRLTLQGQLSIFFLFCRVGRFSNTGMIIVKVTDFSSSTVLNPPLPHCPLLLQRLREVRASTQWHGYRTSMVLR